MPMNGLDYCRPYLRTAHRWAMILCAPALLLLLVAGSVAWAVNDAGLYRNGFARYNTAQRSGIVDADLERIGAELRAYFNGGAEPLAVRAPVYGIEREIFNAREVAHMYDVKRLVRGVYWVAVGAAVWVAATLALGFGGTARRSDYAAATARLAVWSGALTLAGVFGVGIASVISFDALFLLFHRLSFANDLWMLNPRTDYLLILFPGGFWFDATLRVALTSALGAVLLLSGGVGALLYLRWRDGQRQPGVPPAEAA